jgi:shikimate dehydrogenase
MRARRRAGTRRRRADGPMTVHVGVLGWPVAHSRSPAMHNAGFEELGLDWRYELLPVEPERFDEFVHALPARGFAGANVTIPHKLSALALADRASDVARTTGAANTLLFTESGIEAENTDVPGFLEALREQAPKAPEGMEAVVLGAGGAARAAVYALLVSGAARVSVWNRHPDRARILVQDLAQTSQGRLEATEKPDVARAHLLVNATSVGMTKHDSNASDAAQAFKELPLSADVWGDRQIVVDLVYRQGGTALAREARSRGVVCVDGLDVLVHQGAASFQLWTGRKAPLGAMRRGAQDGKTD